MKLFSKAAFAAAAVFVSAIAARAEPVGSASAIIPNASQSQQGTKTDLHLKDQIIRNAELQTADKGALEVTFLDGSRLTMGQNSRLVVDEYVYSGPGGAGKQSIRYTKGVFRFISGSIPKDQVKVQTPTVTIGIRGTVFRTLVNGDGSGGVSVEHGETELTDGNGEKIVLHEGEMVTWGPGGGGFGGVTNGQIQGCQ